jgi:hypothetical protein
MLTEFDTKVARLWNLQYDGMSQEAIRKSLGMSLQEFREARLAALDRYVIPTPEQIMRLQRSFRSEPE